ncbi:MAG: hypothetical protein KDB05_05225 [Planctomycetales bacterium]|nr:hypothetical protein [Planctomycetales bacterium]
MSVLTTGAAFVFNRISYRSKVSKRRRMARRTRSLSCEVLERRELLTADLIGGVTVESAAAILSMMETMEVAGVPSATIDATLGLPAPPVGETTAAPVNTMPTTPIIPSQTAPSAPMPTTPALPTPAPPSPVLTTPNMCQMSLQANAGEFAELSAKIAAHISQWESQQQNLITDTFANAQSALAKLKSTVGTDQLKLFAGNAVNLTWAGASVGILAPEVAGPVGLGAVILGIAANAVIDNDGASAATIESAINSAITSKRQEMRDQVSATRQDWDARFATLLGTAAQCNDVGALRTFLSDVQTALFVVQGAAPKPPSVNSVYRSMLMDFASAKGWSTYIIGSQWHEDNFGTYYHIDSIAAGLYLSIQFPFLVDLQDIVNELNGTRDSN